MKGDSKARSKRRGHAWHSLDPTMTEHGPTLVPKSPTWPTEHGQEWPSCLYLFFVLCLSCWFVFFFCCVFFFVWFCHMLFCCCYVGLASLAKNGAPSATRSYLLHPVAGAATPQTMAIKYAGIGTRCSKVCTLQALPHPSGVSHSSRTKKAHTLCGT